MQYKITHELFKNNSKINFESIDEIENLTVLKNQRVSFQVLLNPSVRAIISTSDQLAITDEMDLKRFRVDVQTEHAVHLYNQLNLKDKEGIKHADILTHVPFIKQDADIAAAVWVDIFLDPEKYSPSETITIKIFESAQMHDEKLVFEKELKLEVVNKLVPNPKDYTIYTDLWQHNSNIARTYEVPLWSDAHFDIMEKVVMSLANLGQKSVMLIGSEAPWNGWGTHIMSKDGSILYEHSIITCSKDLEGEIHTDFTNMQRYIDLCKKYGIDQDYSLYGLLGVWNLPLFPGFEVEGYPESLMIRYYDMREGSYKFLREKKEIVEYISQIIHYFKKTNQFSKLRIAADEPKKDPLLQEKYDESIHIIRSIDKDVKFKLAIDKDDVIEKYNDITSDIATSFPCTTRFYDKLEDSKRKIWYICNIPDKPNTFLHSPLIESRLLGILNALFNYDGILRWAYTCWTDKPRENIHYATSGFPVGDLNIVYPEANGDIALSLRYKALQRGIEDFEMLKIINSERVNQQVYQAIKLNTDPHSYMKASKITEDNLYSLDHEDYDKMRQILIDNL